MTATFGGSEQQPGREGAHLVSTASVQVDNPREAVEHLVEQAQLHRGSLREQDGFTIPFREGGSCRFRITDDGLHLTVDAPTPERVGHVREVVGELVRKHLPGEHELSWQDQ